jgi:prolyl-tRNA synthetase
MGGSASEEFLAPAEHGEDTFVQCENCDYAANTEAVEIAVPPAADPSGRPEQRVLDTPDTPTIATLVDRLNRMDLGTRFTAADTLKNVVLRTRRPGSSSWELLVVGVPGDREVDLKRLGGQLEPVEVAQAEPDDLAREPRLVKGYVGPQLLHEIGVRYLVDPLVVPGSAWVTGANEQDRHATSVVRGRDFEPDGEIGAVEIRDGDRCARCGGGLAIARGIEIGHIFQLGRKFADAFDLDALGPDSKPVRITMGSYGIGISRAVAALAEQSHDDKGLVWPREVAPADVHVVATGRDDTVFTAAEVLAATLEERGLRVLLDDRRGVSPGVKFNDAELLGMPTVVVVGRGLAQAVVEVRDRRTGEREDVAVGQAAERILAACAR